MIPNKRMTGGALDFDFQSPCVECANKFTDRVGCRAFKNRIPESILNGQDDHLIPLPNQENDIVFEKEA